MQEFDKLFFRLSNFSGVRGTIMSPPDTCHTATIVLCTDVAAERSCTPHLFRSFLGISFPGFWVCNLYDCTKMCPCQIVNARVHNLQIIETHIELAKILQIALAESVAVFRYQLFCQRLNQPCAILSTDFPMLFSFHNPLADVPIGKYSHLVGGSVCLSPTFFDNAAYIVEYTVV